MTALAYGPIVAISIISGGIVLLWLAEQLATWLVRRNERRQR